MSIQMRQTRMPETSTMRRPIRIFVTGIAAGIALVFACGQMNPDVDAGADANAATTDCTVWQTDFCVLGRGPGSSTSPNCGSGTGTPQTFAAGWQPFAGFVATSGSNTVL